MGMLIAWLATVLMRPWAMESQRTMPPYVSECGYREEIPKMLTKTAVTLGSLVINLKASSMALAVAPPPQSAIRYFHLGKIPRKLAGSPPLSLMISMVAIARPAPLTRHPIDPSNLIKFNPNSAALTSSGFS